jgi:hypothetical protein
LFINQLANFLACRKKISKIKFEFAAQRAAYAVGKAAKIETVEIRLDISGVKMIGEVEDLQAHARLIFSAQHRDHDAFGDLQIEREKSREAIGIARPDKILIFINTREGEAGAVIEDRREIDIIRQFHIGGDEETIGRIEGLRGARIFANNRRAEIAKERIERAEIAKELFENIKIAGGTPTHIR